MIVRESGKPSTYRKYLKFDRGAVNERMTAGERVCYPFFRDSRSVRVYTDEANTKTHRRFDLDRCVLITVRLFSEAVSAYTGRCVEEVRTTSRVRTASRVKDPDFSSRKMRAWNRLSRAWPIGCVEGYPLASSMVGFGCLSLLA